MSWTLLLGVVLALGLFLLAAFARRGELRRMRRTLEEKDEVARQGGDKAQLEFPVIDLSRCLGCGTCTAVCPEDGVLELVHGQAMVVNGARCMGIAACERECPVDAIKVTMANLEERDDIPAISGELQAIGMDGLYLAGEVTAHALIKTAIDQGSQVAREVAAQFQADPSRRKSDLDLVIVGAGPGGLACALEAKHQGLSYIILEKEKSIGGTVATYPRRKLVLTQPVDMPLVGRLKRTSYTKEELIDFWNEINDEHELCIEHEVEFQGVDRQEDGELRVQTNQGYYDASAVCLAIGRRGVPRKLAVPGEELPKIAYSLMDAASYQGRRILVVGGGDSAVEAALALSEQEGNEVTISYRKGGFFRIKSKNAERLEKAIAADRLQVLFDSQVQLIEEATVQLNVETEAGRQGILLPNDDVFILAGGTPPTELLNQSGVSFDSSLREPEVPTEEQGTGLLPAMAIGFTLALVTLLFALWHSDYYLLSDVQRPTHPKHNMLRPGMGLGLWLGISSTAFIVINLLYVLRRSTAIRWQWGSLQLWMTSHIATGVLALLTAILHSSMAPNDTPGGRAFWALCVLIVTGAIGRYFYAYVPRATNGRELDLTEARAQLEKMSEDWTGEERSFRKQAMEEVSDLLDRRQWKQSFFGRVRAILGLSLSTRRLVKKIRRIGAERSIPEEQVQETVSLVKRAHRASLMVGHYEDLRGVLATWRYLHRWVTVLMLLLLIVHIIHSLSFGASSGGLPR